MDRRSYSALPLIIVDGSGTVKPDGLNNTAEEAFIDVPEGNALGLEPGDYTRVPGATGQTAADYRPFDRSTMASILRHSTIRRPRMSAQHFG